MYQNSPLGSRGALRNKHVWHVWVCAVVCACWAVAALGLQVPTSVVSYQLYLVFHMWLLYCVHVQTFTGIHCRQQVVSVLMVR